MADLLLELGTEELPPLHLSKMTTALGAAFGRQLTNNQIGFGAIKTYNSPRRLALIVRHIDEQQLSSEQVRRGPALAAAYDADGHPTKALIGFAKSCGLEIGDLSEIKTEKGVWIGASIQTIGKKTKDLIAEFFAKSLSQLPIDRRMHWGNSDFEFVRPVHWLVAMWDDAPIVFELFGIPSGNLSRGHRFHADEPIAVNPSNYVDSLKSAKVWVDVDQRQAHIKKEVTALASKLGGRANIEPALLSEVAGLVEYPVALAGQFDKTFLQVPPEAIVAFMEGHQKFFAIFADDGSLLPHFIAISNIESKNPASVISGYERVIYPRLADALFFWQQDLKQDLSAQSKQLKKLVYKDKLGSVWDKVERIKLIVGFLAGELAMDKAQTAQAVQAAGLCKTDLLSHMVGEFPKLQGIMGKYYAEKSGICAAIAEAIEAHYLPRFADDKLPQTSIGQIIAIADRLDTLVGIFAIGTPPSGDKDPFGLRRAALGVLRIIVECHLPINLPKLIDRVFEQIPKEAIGSEGKTQYQDKISAIASISNTIEDFIMMRLKGMDDVGDAFEAIDLRQSGGDVLDFIKREKAVRLFMKHEAFEALAQANKRIVNLLDKPQKAKTTEAKEGLLEYIIEGHSRAYESPKVDLFELKAEGALWRAYEKISPQVDKLVISKNYVEALNLLAEFAPAIDAYFDQVMVMQDDEKIRNNRLSTLYKVRNLFLEIADLSKLSN